MPLLPGLQWTADVDVLTGVNITELDMVSAGLTVVKQEKLLPKAMIAELEVMSGLDRSIAIGKLSKTKEYKTLSKTITEGIRNRMEQILQINSIRPDDILSVKRDAVFILGPTPAKLVLKNGTRYKIKSSYSSFAKLGRNEVYAVPRKRILDVKGIPEEKIDLHREFMGRFILDYLGYLEKGNVVQAAAMIQQFREDYVTRQLPAEFYREFNAESMFAIKAGRGAYGISSLGQIPLSEIEITHNLRNVIVPLAKTIL